MKRIHSNQNKDKKAELRKLVLMQLSTMRKKMKKEHPGMLESLREKIEAAKKSVAPPGRKATTPQQQSELVIDQEKNQQTIEMMLNLKSDNPGFEKAVKAILSKQNN